MNSDLPDINYDAYFGTNFKSSAELSGGINIKRPKDISNQQFAADCIEFGAWHAMNIWPKLNYFSGYEGRLLKLNKNE